MVLQLSSDLFQQASFQPSPSQAPCAYQVHEQLLLGWAWLPSAVFQFKARFRGNIHQNRPGQGKFGICSFKGMHIHIKMHFLSEILKS